jgi:hypothetical protein
MGNQAHLLTIETGHKYCCSPTRERSVAMTSQEYQCNPVMRVMRVIRSIELLSRKISPTTGEFSC